MAKKGAETRERLLDAAIALFLRQGYAGTSLDDILRDTGLTKGAFFHHFRSKSDLALAAAQHAGEQQARLFAECSAQAEAMSDDPLERMLVFLRLSLELPQTPAGCIFATYTHESAQFEPEIQAFVAERFRRWQAAYEQKFVALIAARTPALPVTAAELAQMLICMIEGGLILSSSDGNPGCLARQSQRFRQYLELLFRPAQTEPARAQPDVVAVA